MRLRYTTQNSRGALAPSLKGNRPLALDRFRVSAADGPVRGLDRKASVHPVRRRNRFQATRPNRLICHRDGTLRLLVMGIVGAISDIWFVARAFTRLLRHITSAKWPQTLRKLANY